MPNDSNRSRVQRSARLVAPDAVGASRPGSSRTAAPPRSLRRAGALVLSSATCLSCDAEGMHFGLSRSDDTPTFSPPPANGPELGAIAQATPVRSRPEPDAPILGYLHAGARVVRAENEISREGCRPGWYPIRPTGVVCLSEGATLDLDHPTLQAMATAPDLKATLPYAYARTRADGQLFAVDAERDTAVRAERSITSRSGMAIVGSWTAATAQDAPTLELAMMTQGRFLDASNLEEAQASTFKGVELTEDKHLPLAFVIVSGAFDYQLASTAQKRAALTYRNAVSVSGKGRRVEEVEFIESTDDIWLQASDVRVAQVPKSLPDFARDKQRWLDVNLSTETLIAFSGTTPLYATLVSTGKSKGGEAHDTLTGEFTILAKHITALNAQVRGFAERVEIHDTPWLLELSSGQMIHGAFWHDRFGQEHGFGHIQLAPKDARWVWNWVGAPVPSGWHARVLSAEDAEKTTLDPTPADPSKVPSSEQHTPARALTDSSTSESDAEAVARVVIHR